MVIGVACDLKKYDYKFAKMYRGSYMSAHVLLNFEYIKRVGEKR